MPARLAAAALSFSVVACASIGPATVPHDRIDYASAIGNSWKEQTLLNIAKLRYADMPIFLEVSQVIAGYQLQSTVTGSVTLGNFTASLIDRLTAQCIAVQLLSPRTSATALRRGPRLALRREPLPARRQPRAARPPAITRPITAIRRPPTSRRTGRISPTLGQRRRFAARAQARSAISS
jgi:hypothetical protein